MLFDNIDLINEGKQADEYRARKAKEAEDKKKAEKEAYDKRYRHPVGSRHGYNPKKTDEEDIDDDDFYRGVSSTSAAMHDVARRQNNFNKSLLKGKPDTSEFSRHDTNKIMDASNRWIRRHPKQWNESGIFESVDMI